MNEIPSQDPADDDTLAGVLRSSFRKMLQGLAIMGGGGASADITGAINITGQITCNGKDISDAHQHSGVYPGSGVSGGVV